MAISLPYDREPSAAKRTGSKFPYVDERPSAAVEARVSRAAAAHGASPRIVTTGGNSTPRETARYRDDNHVLIDWFAFTVIPPEGEPLRWIVDELRQFIADLAFIPTGKGWNGYRQRHDIQHGNNEANLGLLAHGGASQRGSVHIELNAQACALITDWQIIQAWGERYQANITRIDLAHDDLTGQTITVDIGLRWHKSGEFNSNGRPAKARLIDDLGTGDGKTLYVGNRAYGKMLRIYDKGKQLGDPDSPWVRVEVELHNKSRLIPWDVLAYPSHYLAGAYPCLAYLSAEQKKIRTIHKAATISLESSVKHLRQTGGKLVNLMLQTHGGDAFAVVNELKREGIPRRLSGYAALLPDVLDSKHGT